MQTQGSLRDGGLSTLLQTMQSERATGTLAIEHGDESASLYFLFGHLFHASGPSGQGEDVVIGGESTRTRPMSSSSWALRRTSMWR